MSDCRKSYLGSLDSRTEVYVRSVAVSKTASLISNPLSSLSRSFVLAVSLLHIAARAFFSVSVSLAAIIPCAPPHFPSSQMVTLYLTYTPFSTTSYALGHHTYV